MNKNKVSLSVLKTALIGAPDPLEEFAEKLFRLIEHLTINQPPRIKLSDQAGHYRIDRPTNFHIFLSLIVIIIRF